MPFPDSPIATNDQTTSRHNWTVLGQCHHLVAKSKNHASSSLSPPFIPLLGVHIHCFSLFMCGKQFRLTSLHHMMGRVSNSFIHPFLIFSFIFMFLFTTQKPSMSWLIHFINNITGFEVKLGVLKCLWTLKVSSQIFPVGISIFNPVSPCIYLLIRPFCEGAMYEREFNTPYLLFVLFLFILFFIFFNF